MSQLFTSTIDVKTRSLLMRLQNIPLLKDMRLSGGTALALQLGHRHSIDLDFFGKMTVSWNELQQTLEQQGLTCIVRSESPMICITQIENIKVDFVDYSSVKWIEPAVVTDGIIMAGLKDIGAIKIASITGRGDKKDFIDLYFLLQHFSLKELIECYTLKFETVSVFHVIRSLTYFDDAEASPLPMLFAQFDWNEAKETIRKAVIGL